MISQVAARGAPRGAASPSSVSAKPRIAVSGVLISCEALATKSRRTVSSRRTSVMSWKTATAPFASASEKLAACTASARRSLP